MDQKQAWEGLFSLNPPAGTDLDIAANVLDGVQETHGVKLAAPVLERANEFLMEPDAFIAANPGDVRVPLWTRLAASLGVTIAPTAPSSSTAPSAATPPTPAPPAATSAPPPAVASAPPAATSPPPPAATPAPPKGLSPSALRKAMVAAAAGPSLPVVVQPVRPSGDDTGNDGEPPGSGTPRAQRQSVPRPPSGIGRRVHPGLLATLESEPYLAQRDNALELARHAVGGDAASRTELDALVVSLRRDVRRMDPGYQVTASAELLLSLIEGVEAGRDRADLAWFRANFLTGSY